MPPHSTLARTWLTGSRLRFVARPAFALLTGAALAVERLRDAVQTVESAAGARRLAGSLTAAVKTFERPRALHRLLDSLRRNYPELRVVVADDSTRPASIPGLEIIALPYDSGVSAGRNAALARVRTPCVLVLDDDFVLTRGSGIAAALALMESHPEIDIMGGRVINLPFYRSAPPGPPALFPTTAMPTYPPGSRIAGLPVHDKVPQFFIGRTQRVAGVGWDPALKRRDHADFFTRAKGTLTTVYNPAMSCLHVQTPFDARYMAIRTDMASDEAVLLRKYGTTVSNA